MGNSPVAGDKRKRTQLTLHSLPQEVVLSIVEWTAQIALEDQLEQERLEHDRHHEQHHHHDHHHVPGPLGHDGPPPGPGLFAGLFGGGGFPDENANADAPGDPQGIGDVPFMQNLFGMFGNGGLPVNLPAVVPPPPPVIVPAAVPPVASNTQNNQDADDTDDEMPPLETMGTSPALQPTASTSTSTSAPADTTESGNSNASTGSTLIGGGVGQPTTASGSSSNAVTVQDDADDDDEMPPLEPSYLGNPSTSLGLAPVTPATPDIGPIFWPANDNPAPPFTPMSGGIDTPLPSAPLSGALAGELQEMQQSTSIYTTEELDEMPDMESSSGSPVVQLTTNLAVNHESDWSTEEEGEGEEEDQADEEDEDDEDDEEEAENDDFTDEGHGSMPHSASSPTHSSPPVSYEDGLPSCPYLPLALVSRSFLNAARTLLYGRHVHLVDVYQAHLFLRTLTSPQVSVYDDEPDADDEDARQQHMLSYLVRDLTFDIRNLVSLGRGGGNLFIGIIEKCSRLERITYSTDFMRSAQKPLEKALSGCSNMRCVHLRGGDVPAKDLVWEMRNLAVLLNKWPKLDNLQVLWLKHSINGPLLPAPKIQLKRLSLAYPDITDSDLAYLLKGSKGTLKQLDLHKPTSKLTRAGVARILIEHGPTLTSLQLDITSTWHPTTTIAPPAEASNVTEDRAAKCKYLMDGLIGHLKVLSELKLSGSLASTILLARLPKTITVLAFQDNLGMDMAKVLALFKKKKIATNGKSKKSIPIVAPKLRCFTFSRSDGAMLTETMMQNFEKVGKQRKACVHWHYYQPMAVWRPDGTPPHGAALGMMGGFLGMAAMAAGGMPFPPDFGFDGFDFPMPMAPPIPPPVF